MDASVDWSSTIDAGFSISYPILVASLKRSILNIMLYRKYSRPAISGFSADLDIEIDKCLHLPIVYHLRGSDTIA